jgi:hypothetical protein
MKHLSSSKKFATSMNIAMITRAIKTMAATVTGVMWPVGSVHVVGLLPA